MFQIDAAVTIVFYEVMLPFHYAIPLALCYSSSNMHSELQRILRLSHAPDFSGKVNSVLNVNTIDKVGFSLNWSQYY